MGISSYPFTQCFLPIPFSCDFSSVYTVTVPVRSNREVSVWCFAVTIWGKPGVSCDKLVVGEHPQSVTGLRDGLGVAGGDCEEGGQGDNRTLL